MTELASTSDELKRTKATLAHWSHHFQTLYGSSLPRSYLAYDLESSGFSRQNDLILEWGHCLVRDTKIVDRNAIYLNWYALPDVVPSGWLDSRLDRIKFEMQAAGRAWHITPELLKTKGVHPKRAIQFIYDLFQTVIAQPDMAIVGHNIRAFDSQMLESSFAQDLGIDFTFPLGRVFDTGVIEKASQMAGDDRLTPKHGESFDDYMHRINYTKLSGVKWNLDPHCIEKYGLTASHGIGRDAMHGAGTDAYVVHLLFERYRGIANAFAAEAIGNKPPAVSPPVRAARRPPPSPTVVPSTLVHADKGIKVDKEAQARETLAAAQAVRAETKRYIDACFDKPTGQNFRRQRNR